MSNTGTPWPAHAARLTEPRITPMSWQISTGIPSCPPRSNEPMTLADAG
jgi:hypothetical protein